ncbi:malonyl CoA-acyl carrier protein transacylase [Scheffersomyces xylosifermentans]|uniref:malonyl CoA-acyl carrier protein transacylase n=1 Tax=Scheffersomyces xylosifermentans TaxID=1304137 RepID=UPI00315DFF0A
MSSRIFIRCIHRKNSTYALALPGQGIIRNGFLTPYKKFEDHYRQHLEAVDEALGEKFTTNLYNESPDFSKTWLLRTSNAQPAILLTTYIILDIIKREFYVDLVSNAKFLLGHSLGEYTSLLLSGIIDLPTAVKVVRKRGQLMEDLVANGPKYGMSALMFKPPSFDSVVEQAQKAGILANINSRQQVVISGEVDVLQNFVTSVNSTSKVILRSIPLPVTIAFHNEILKQIVPDLRSEIYSHKVREQMVPIVSNLTGEATYDHDTTISRTLEANYRPVQWVKSLEFLIANGITTVVNVGPGDVLQGLNGKFKVENIGLDTPESFSVLKEKKFI